MAYEWVSSRWLFWNKTILCRRSFPHLPGLRQNNWMLLYWRRIRPKQTSDTLLPNQSAYGERNRSWLWARIESRSVPSDDRLWPSLCQTYETLQMSFGSDLSLIFQMTVLLTSLLWSSSQQLWSKPIRKPQKERLLFLDQFIKKCFSNKIFITFIAQIIIQELVFQSFI